MSDEEDPYAISSDSEDEEVRKPPPKIHIEGRENADINQLKTALTENKEVTKDESRKEELEQLKQAKDTKKMKQDFETGAVSNKSEEEGAETSKSALDEEREKLAEVTKEQYSQFKNKFEKLDETLGENLEEKLKRMEREMVGLGKESLASAKEKFEKGEGDVQIERSQVEIERSADMKKMKAAFNRQEMTADEAPKECAVCSKIVYPVERVFANKQLYHVQCFKCNKCQKKLAPTNFNSHEGVLLCKVHMLEVFHPELARTMDPTNTEEDEHDADDDDEFAVSSKPKQLQGVVKSGASAVQDELAQIKSLKDKKGDFESSVKEASNVEKKTKVEDELLQAGRVKANTERFVSGAALEGSEEEEEEGERDPNIIRENKKKRKEELHFDQIGDIKNKWKTGGVETSEKKEAGERKELEELKGGPSVKERFQERSEGDEKVVERQWDKSELDTAAAAEARKSFMEGAAYQSGTVEKSAADLNELKFNQLKGFKERFEKGEDDGEVQKTVVEGVDVQLGSIKAAFEKPDEEMTPEERAALKKREIEAEFLRYKLARRAAAERTKQQEEEGQTPVVSPGDEVADVGSIKDRFDKGDAFKSQGQDGKELDVEFKMAGKAREKFRQIDASGATPVMPGQNKKTEPSKWDKKDDKPVAEVINRREQAADEAPEDEDSFDVKNLMNKFKNIGEGGASSAKSNSEQRAELESLKTEAKSFKQRFEKAPEADEDMADEKRRQMQEEFEALKKEREEAQRRLDEERAQEEGERQTDKEDVNIKADHASKMAAKWEKLQAKEAKKAEKGRMPEKKTATRFVMREQPKCDVCTKSVYVAEQFQCFGTLYHVQCFRCNVCRQALRVEKVHRGKDGVLLCPVHFKLSEEVPLAGKPVNTEENNNEIEMEGRESTETEEGRVEN